MNQLPSIAHGVPVGHTGFTGLLRWARSFHPERAGLAAPRLLAAALAEAGNLSNQLFMVALTLGAASLALWTHIRFPSLAPERLPRTLLHAALAFGVLMVTPHLLDESAPLKGIFLIVLPALVYALLGTIWVLKQAQTALGVR
jgi:hypothetical protein